MPDMIWVIVIVWLRLNKKLERLAGQLQFCEGK